MYYKYLQLALLFAILLLPASAEEFDSRSHAKESLKNDCKKKWGTDYEMVEYCIKNKEAKNPHINNKSSFGDSSFSDEAHLNKFSGNKFSGNKFGGSSKFRSR